MVKMNVLNLNPDSDIGASAWLVEMDDHRILLDAGMHPKREGRKLRPGLARPAPMIWMPSPFPIVIMTMWAPCPWPCGSFPGPMC